MSEFPLILGLDLLGGSSEQMTTSPRAPLNNTASVHRHPGMLDLDGLQEGRQYLMTTGAKVGTQVRYSVRALRRQSTF